MDDSFRETSRSEIETLLDFRDALQPALTFSTIFLNVKISIVAIKFKFKFQKSKQKKKGKKSKQKKMSRLAPFALQEIQRGNFLLARFLPNISLPMF